MQVAEALEQYREVFVQAMEQATLLDQAVAKYLGSDPVDPSMYLL